MKIKELADLKDYLDKAMSAKRDEFLKIRGSQVSKCFTEFRCEDDGSVVIFFALVFSYENAEKDIFITETKREVTTDEIVLTDHFKKALLKALECKFDLFTDRISPYL